MAFNHDDLILLFNCLDDELSRRSSNATVTVVGSAAMTLGYDDERSASDIDCSWEPYAPLVHLIATFSRIHGLPSNWMNNGATIFMPSMEDDLSKVVYQGKCLSVHVPSVEYLLAMKLLSIRNDKDLVTAVRLIELGDFQSAEECMECLAQYFPNAPSIASRTRSQLDAIFENLHQAHLLGSGEPLSLTLAGLTSNE